MTHDIKFSHVMTALFHTRFEHTKFVLCIFLYVARLQLSKFVLCKNVNTIVLSQLDSPLHRVALRV